MADTGTSTGAITITPVTTPAETERFIRLPLRLNKGDPNWRAPLLMERREALSPKHNPIFQHMDAQFFLAVRDGRDVGRISAQIDHLAPSDPDRPSGYFGLIAAEDDQAIFSALFAAAEAWLKARGVKLALGPFNLSINEETGLLVEGFDTPPMILMGHDAPYAGPRIEAEGYVKAKDLLAYITGVTHFSPAIRKRLERGPGPGVVLRQVDMKRFAEEVRGLVDIYNDAWSGNWGFTPITEAETEHMGKSMKPLLNPKLFWFMEIDGEPAAFGLMLPNLNEAIADLDGKLLPFGWAKLLWRLKVKGVRSGRVPLMGVKRKFASDRRGALAPFAIVDAIIREGVKLGIDSCETSWILEDNRPMNHILESMGARPYKTYRVYSKALD